MYGYTNEDGEPIMDGTAYRFEQELDAQYAEERHLDDDEFFGPERDYEDFEDADEADQGDEADAAVPAPVA